MKTYKQATYRTVDKVYCDKCKEEIVQEPSHDYKFKLVSDKCYSDYGDYWIEWGYEIKDLCMKCSKLLRQVLLDNDFPVEDLD